MTQNEIERAREYYVVKGNEIIQKTHHTLGALQQKVLCMMISMIKPGDIHNKNYEMAVADFCHLANISTDSGKTYANVKAAIDGIDKQTIWIEESEGEEVRLRWLNRVRISSNRHKIIFSFHEDIFPYLYELKDNFTRFRLSNVLLMKNKYSIRLYEILKSYASLKSTYTIQLEQLKKLLNTPNYPNYYDFNKRVLEPAVKEINLYADITVEVEPVKRRSRAVNYIQFSIYDENEMAEYVRGVSFKAQIDD